MGELIKHLTPTGWTILIALIVAFAAIIITLAVVMFVLANRNSQRND